MQEPKQALEITQQQKYVHKGLKKHDLFSLSLEKRCMMTKKSKADVKKRI